MQDVKSNTVDSPKRRLPIWFIILVVVMLGLTFFGDHGILRVWKSNQQKNELEQQIKSLEEVNAGLRQEIDALNNDLRTIESLARRELGMVRDDEQVYQFPTEKQQFQPPDDSPKLE